MGDNVKDYELDWDDLEWPPYWDWNSEAYEIQRMIVKYWREVTNDIMNKESLNTLIQLESAENKLLDLFRVSALWAVHLIMK